VLEVVADRRSLVLLLLINRVIKLFIMEIWFTPFIGLSGIGFLLLIGLFPFIHNTIPLRYNVLDDHELCTVAGWSFFILCIWYIVLMYWLFKGAYFNTDWGQRLLIYPNLILAVVGFFGIIALFSTYSSHDDEGFARILNIMNAIMIFINTYYCHQIGTKTISLEHKYGFQAVVNTTGIFLIAWSIEAYILRQWWLLAALVPHIFLVFRAYQQLSPKCTKIPFKSTL